MPNRHGQSHTASRPQLGAGSKALLDRGCVQMAKLIMGKDLTVVGAKISIIWLARKDELKYFDSDRLGVQTC